MKVIRIFIILAFLLAPLSLFAIGDSGSGNSDMSGSQPNASGATGGSGTAESGTASGTDNGALGSGNASDQSGTTTSTAGTTTSTAGTPKASGAAPAVLKTIGNDEVKFTAIRGYNFGTGKVKDIVLTQDGTVQYIVVNMKNAQGDFLVPPSMVSIANANGGVTATFNFGAGGTGELTQVQGGAQSQMGSGTVSPEAIFASSLLKYDVVGSDNQKIGKVDDVVLNLQDQKVAYLAITQGGALGAGKNLYAVSYDNAQFDPQNGTIMLNLSANDLKNAKGFDKANWPSQAEIGTQSNLGSGGANAQGNAQSATGTTSTAVPGTTSSTMGTEGAMGSGGASGTGGASTTTSTTGTLGSGSSTSTTTSTMGTQGSGTVEQANPPLSSDTSQPGNAPNGPVNSPQGQQGQTSGGVNK